MYVQRTQRNSSILSGFYFQRRLWNCKKLSSHLRDVFCFPLHCPPWEENYFQFKNSKKKRNTSFIINTVWSGLARVWSIGRLDGQTVGRSFFRQFGCCGITNYLKSNEKRKKLFVKNEKNWMGKWIEEY